MDDKIKCRVCGKSKTSSEFYKNVASPNGLRSDCIECFKQMRKDEQKRRVTTTEFPIVPRVEIREGELVTDSLEIARVFGKSHKDVLRSIEKLDCSKEFRRRNFAPSNYLNQQGKTQPSFTVTRDGWTFLVMGFTGSKAAAFKEAYIQEFNRMENHIKRGSGDEVLIDLVRGIQAIAEKHDKKFDDQLHAIVGVDNQVKILSENVSGLETEVSRIRSDVDNITKRRIPRTSKDPWRSFIYNRSNIFHRRKCPYCLNEEIQLNKMYATGAKNKPIWKTIEKIGSVQWHHACGHKNVLYDQVIPLCLKCHDGITHGRISNAEFDAKFKAILFDLNGYIKERHIHIQMEVE